MTKFQRALRDLNAAAWTANRAARDEGSPLHDTLKTMCRDTDAMVDGYYAPVTMRPVVLPDFNVRNAE